MKKIAVIGSINMDMTATADHIPRPGETIAADTVQYLPGGKGANQAVAAARLGGQVTMFGCVGNDPFGKRLCDNLRDNGIHTAEIETIDGVSSGLAMIVVAENDNAITMISGANGCVLPDNIDRHRDAILESDIVLLQNEIPTETVFYAAKLLHDAGKTVIYNPAPARTIDPALLSYVTYLTPNEHEARIVLGDETTPLETLLKQQNGKLIVTLGSRGAAGFADGEPVLVPALHASVIDTTGAGDTFNGALAFALANDQPIRKALRFANAAAALSTEAPGAQGGMPTLDAVLAVISR